MLTSTGCKSDSGTQTITYDDLDRLITAGASGGSGGTYSVETYEYDPDTGNIANTTPLGDYTYTITHTHAVSETTSGWDFDYDANGNMTTRIATGGTYNYTYDEENHLTGVSGSATATFVYDGDGVRVKGTVNGVTTTYVGSHFEWTGSTTTMKKYFYAGGARVAVRTGTGSPSWLLGDHLGSQALTVSYAGTSETGEKRYDAWGEQRYTSGTTPTTFRYTGQRFEESLGIYYYGARWVDPALGRWLSPDTIIPDPYDSESYDRYAYVRNNPVNRVDPTGHLDDGQGVITSQDIDWLSGWDKSYMRNQGTRNTCAANSLAAGISVIEGYYVDTQVVLDHLPINDKFNTGVLPWRQANAVDEIGSENYGASYTNGNDRNDLIDNLYVGLPTIVSVSFRPSEKWGHALLVVGYDPVADELWFFDPANGNLLPESKFPTTFGYTFWDAWKCNTDLNFGVIKEGSMVTIYPSEGNQADGGGGSGSQDSNSDTSQ